MKTAIKKIPFLGKLFNKKINIQPVEVEVIENKEEIETMQAEKDKVIRFDIQRKMISHMTTESWKTIPHVTYIYEPDVTQFMEEFQKLKNERNKKISINTLMLRLIVEGLKAAPELNAHIRYNERFVKGRVDILDEINFSIPWILPTGEMMTINLRGFESKTLDEMIQHIEEISYKIENTNLQEALFEMSAHDTIQKLKRGRFNQGVCKLIGATLGDSKVTLLSMKERRAYNKIPKEQRLGKKELEQGSVLVTNFGSLDKNLKGFAGIIEIIPPQVCAISVGAIQEKPGVYTGEDGTKQIGIRKILPLCIAFDHRAVDFGHLVPFMRALDEVFEHPEVIHEW